MDGLLGFGSIILSSAIGIGVSVTALRVILGLATRRPVV